MSSTKCKICNEDSLQNRLFCRWSTDRYFNREKALEAFRKENKIVTKNDVNVIRLGDYKVCGCCSYKYGIMER